jgi:hypothetical protein
VARAKRNGNGLEGQHERGGIIGSGRSHSHLSAD